MVLKIADRGHVPAFMVMEVMQAAADRVVSGKDVLHMEVGQPGTAAPRGVREAAKVAIDADRLGYTVALGIDPLREAIAQHYRDLHGLDVPAERVVVTTGSSAGFLLSFLACFNPGDRVALAEPGYPCYRNILLALGLTPVALPVDHGSRYQPTVAMLEALEEPLDGLILASPSNPTGTMVSQNEMIALTRHCREHGIRLISDEIYHGIGYGMNPVCAVGHDDDSVVINSFSKYFSMTGWRIGWMVVPMDLLRPIERLAQNFFISAPTLSQHAAVAAFDCREELQSNIAVYAANRDLLLDALPRAGLNRLSQADGGFYIYADISEWTDDSAAFCRALLDETGVAITPGLDFDPFRGAQTARISFSRGTSEITEAARRLQAWMASRKRV
ncbi:MAG: pyridoxal phosphate-dependent aminotransferase [Alphaproteobacteria bacterium]|jgi:aspartate/methionine/tyrosine aminotransferase